MRQARNVLIGMAMVALGAIAQTLINGGGATFPYPMYSKWFNDYKAKTGVSINYQSKGSGFGVAADHRGHGGLRRQRYADDGHAGEGLPDQARDGRAAFPHRTWRGRAHLQRQGSYRSFELHPGGAGRHLPRSHHQVERSGTGEGQSGREPSQGRYRGGASRRGQRDDLHLGRLPGQDQQGVGDQGGPRRFGAMAGRA